MKITDLIIDPKSFGSKFWLTGVSEVHEYRDGHKTDAIIGHRYDVCLVEKSLEKVGIKVDGPKILDAPESGYSEVTFSDLEIYVYWHNGQPQVAAKASNIQLANRKS